MDTGCVVANPKYTIIGNASEKVIDIIFEFDIVSNSVDLFSVFFNGINADLTDNNVFLPGLLTTNIPLADSNVIDSYMDQTGGGNSNDISFKFEVSTGSNISNKKVRFSLAARSVI